LYVASTHYWFVTIVSRTPAVRLGRLVTAALLLLLFGSVPIVTAGSSDNRGRQLYT